MNVTRSMRRERSAIDIVDFDAARTDEIVRLWRESFEFGVGVVDPHPIAEQREFFVNTVVPNNSIRIALLDTKLVGFIAATKASITHLYVHVGHHHCGIGTQLLEWANTQSNGNLWLTRLRETQSLARSTKSTDSKFSPAVSSRTGNWPISSTNGQQTDAMKGPSDTKPWEKSHASLSVRQCRSH